MSFKTNWVLSTRLLSDHMMEQKIGIRVATVRNSSKLEILS